MHRASVGNLKEAFTLCRIERASKGERPIEMIPAVNAAMIDVDLNPFEGPLLAIGVHTQRDRRARPEGRTQIVVGVRPRPVTTDAGGFVRDELHRADGDVVLVPPAAGLGHGHAWVM